MSTGDTYMSIVTGRLCSAHDLRDRVLGYLRDRSGDLAARVYDSDGVFSALTISSPGNDQITISGSGPATDGLGNFLDPSQCVDGADNFMAGVGFQNTNAVTYHVALRYATIPSGAQQNSEGHPEYVGTTEFIGESGDPSTVVDNGNGTITLTISGLFGGLQGTPRKAYVWLKIPRSSTSQHKELCTVVWDGANSKITTSHSLGQTTISTNAADYTVLVPGPTIRTTDLSAEAGYAYVGTVRGSGLGSTPTSFTTTGQVLIDTSLSEVNAVLDAYSSTNQVTGLSTEAGPATVMPTTLYDAGSCVFGGMIYVMGGSTDLAISSDVSSNRMLNPATNAWTSKAAVPAQGSGSATRSGQRLVATDTKIYVFGGGINLVGSHACDVVQIYDPNANTWGAIGASMPANRSNMYVGKIGDYIYVAGGVDETNTDTNTTYRYSISGNSWSTMTALSNPYANGAYAVLNDQLYLIGGQRSGSATSDVLRYDPASDSWLARASLPTVLNFCRATVVNGLIHVIGGANNVGYAQRVHYIYNPTADAWIDAGKPPMQPVKDEVFEAVDGIGHVLGGATVQGASTEIAVNSHIQVDLSQVYLSTGAGILASTGKQSRRSGSGASTLTAKPTAMRHSPSCSDGSRIFFCGGDSGAAASAEFWVYYPESNHYQRLPDMPSARLYNGCVYHPRENAIYVVGGCSAPAGADVTNIDRFDCATETWTSFGSTLARNGFGQAVLVGDKIHMFGGGTVGTTTASTSHLIYNIRSRSVTSGTVLPASRRWPVVIAVPKSVDLGSESAGSTIYIMGGDAGASVLSTIYVYDTVAGTMETHSASLSAARGYAEAAVIPGTMKAVIVGGVSPTTAASSLVTLVDLPTMTFTALTTLTSSRLWTSAQILDGLIYMFSGSSGTSAAPTAQTTANQVWDANAIRYRRPQPRNYSNDHRANVVGFAAGEIYGAHSWLVSETIDMVASGDQ